jgi:hypothetical protein
MEPARPISTVFQTTVTHRFDFQSRRFLNPEEAAAVGEAFTGLYPVENNPAIIQKALADPAGYVLKPQREGGGMSVGAGDRQATWILLTRHQPG